MADISAALVKQLRELTQLPMMDCKKALQDAEGDIVKAQDILRKSGALAAAKKAGRETAEGRVATFDDPAGFGEVADDEGRRWWFHCTAIADGTRTIAEGAEVCFAIAE